ncbi:MAG: methyl-accepting chemotaxis protein [Lachnospiraceae bacterium]|nr:methyl-accepting chemotaxis protein [Lachnospiraceae bacterium]
MKGIRGKLVLMTIGIVTLCVLISGIISYIAVSKIMKAELEKTYRLKAEKTAEELNAWLIDQARNVSSQCQAIQGYGLYEKDCLVPYLENYVATYDDREYIYDLYFTDVNNVMSSGTGYEPDDSIDFREREWFKNASVTDGVYCSTPYKDSDSGKPVITLSRAVYSDGELMGVLALDIFVDMMEQMVDGENVPDDSYIFITDAKQGVVDHPNPSYSYDEAPKELLSVTDADYTSLSNRLSSSDADGVSIKDYDGKERTFFSSVIGSNGWNVIVAVSNDVINASMNPLMRGFILSLLISVAAGVAVSMIIAGNISNPIVKLLNKIESNDLSEDIEINSRDEIGKLARDYNSLINEVRRLMEASTRATESMKDFSGALIKDSEDVSDRTRNLNRRMEEIAVNMDDQAGTVGEGRTRLEGFDLSISEFEERFARMNDIVRETLGQLETSSNMIKTLEASTAETSENMNRISGEVKQLEEISGSITNIVSVISNISGQTNLLALNASIEAARAGEAGRGFAVVAEQIRSLSEQTASATDDISGLIKTIREKINDTVSSIEDSESSYSSNAGYTHEVIESFESIDEKVRIIGDINRELTLSVEDFAGNRDGLVNAFGSIDERVGQSREHTDSAMLDAKEQAEMVNRLIERSKELQAIADNLKESSRLF